MPRTPRVGSIPPYGIKAPVKASTTGNITLSGAQTIDSVSVVAGDRVLVRNQTDTTENGIYNVKNGAWERATDANDADDIVNGTMVLDAKSGVVYQLLFSGDFDPGTTTVTVDNTGTAFNLESKHWAQYPEDSPVPEGDGTEFSALHHSKKSEGFKDKANQWAEQNEDVEVETGQYSALHWSKKSQGHASSASSSAASAASFRDKAEQWANENEDVEVETGEYSAYHWAQKSQAAASGVPGPSAGDAGKSLAVSSSESDYDLVVWSATASGTDTLTASLGWTVYHGNHTISLKTPNTNTGAVTLNLDSLGAKDVTLSDGTALPAGSLEAGKVYSLWYDGTKFIVLNPSVSQTVAEAGAQSEGVMTPLRTQEWYDGKFPSAVQDSFHVGGGMYLMNSGQALGSINISTATSQGTTTSIGPTGSGADHIETELDVLPSNTTALLVKVHCNFESESSGSFGVRLITSHGDASNNPTFDTLRAEGVAQAAGELLDASGTEVWLPINSSNVYNVWWFELNNTTNTSIIFYYVGYRVG